MAEAIEKRVEDSGVEAGFFFLIGSLKKSSHRILQGRTVLFHAVG